MEITLISPIFADMGLSTISPLLKREGHRVRLLFIPGLMQDSVRPLHGRAVVNISEFVSQSGIVGISGLSENFFKTAHLIDKLKERIRGILVWGGVHATLRPRDCIEYADVVCVGEGEEAMIELVRSMEKGEKSQNIKNLIFRSAGGKKQNPELRLPVELNRLLPLDYELDSQYIMENAKIRNVVEPDFRGCFFSYSSRGCPFRCSYCSSAAMQDLYKGERLCRQRSVEKTIEELKGIKERFPSCNKIWFNEADFLSGKTLEEIDTFSRRYKEEVDIPFYIWTHPGAITDKKVELLKNAGIRGLSIGTVNGSDRSQREIYKRYAPAGAYKLAAQILKKYGLEVDYDFILCNPYENNDDIIATIKLLIELPKPYRVIIYSLAYFPGTELYDKVVKDGIIKNGQPVESYTKAAYRAWKYRGNSEFLNIVASLMRGRAKRLRFLGMNCYGLFLPEPILKILIKKPVIKFFERLPLRSFIYNAIASMIMFCYTILKKISLLAKEPLRSLQKLKKRAN